MAQGNKQARYRLSWEPFSFCFFHRVSFICGSAAMRWNKIEPTRLSVQAIGRHLRDRRERLTASAISLEKQEPRYLAASSGDGVAPRVFLFFFINFKHFQFRLRRNWAV